MIKFASIKIEILLKDHHKKDKGNSKIDEESEHCNQSFQSLIEGIYPAILPQHHLELIMSEELFF